MGETKEPKIARKGVLVALGIICIILVACFGGVAAAYTLMINDKSNTISSLNYQISQLNSSVTNLQNQVASANSTINSLTSQVTNLQNQLDLTVAVATYTVVGTLSYANVSVVYVGIIVDSINPSFSPNLRGSFMFLTFSGQLEWTFPGGFVSGNMVAINGTISFDKYSQTYFLNWINGSLCSDTVEGVNEQLGLQLTMTPQKTKYSLGEPVDMTLTITNLGNQTINFSEAPSWWDFLVSNDTDNCLYDWLNSGRVFPMWVGNVPLDPGMNLTSGIMVWPQMCNKTVDSYGVPSSPVSPGTYYIVGRYLGYNLQTTPIQIIIAQS